MISGNFYDSLQSRQQRRGASGGQDRFADAEVSTPIPVQELPLRSVELLRAVVSGLKIDPEKQPQEYVLIPHARHVTQLAEEIIFLESHEHKASSPVIARAIYESLFKLALAIVNPSLAAEKALREVEWRNVQITFPGERPEKLKEIRLRPEYAPIGRSVKSIGQRWKLANVQIESDKMHSTFWCARNAGMARVYQRQYAELSAFAHASADTFVLRTFNITTERVLVHVTYALLLAATKITTRYCQHFPSELVAEVQEFEQLFKSYDSKGHLRLFQLSGFTKTGSTKPVPPEKEFEKN